MVPTGHFRHIHPGLVELPLARINFHGPKPVPAIKVLLYIFCLDHESLRQQSVLGASMGFTGKQVIHPSQIPIVHEAFSPSAEQIDWATELIKAFDEHQATGKVMNLSLSQCLTKLSSDAYLSTQYRT